MNEAAGTRDCLLALVVCRPGSGRGSRPEPAFRSRSQPEPYNWPNGAQVPGFDFVIRLAGPRALALHVEATWPRLQHLKIRFSFHHPIFPHQVALVSASPIDSPSSPLPPSIHPRLHLPSSCPLLSLVNFLLCLRLFGSSSFRAFLSGSQYLRPTIRL